MTLKKSSTLLLLLLYVLLVVIPIITVGQWLLIESTLVNKFVSKIGLFNPIITPDGVVDIATHTLTLTTRLIGLVGSMIGVLPLFLGLWILTKIFKRYRKNQVFTLKNSYSYKLLGYVFVFDSLIAKPLSGLLLVLCATLSNPPGHRYILITYSFPNIEALFSGFIIILIAKVMLIGHQLQEEQNSVI